MGMKLQIDNACWLGDDAWFHRGTMFLEEGRIVRLESHFASDAPAKGSAPAALRWTTATRRIDAKGLFIVPGLIDAHVHLREPGQRVKEGIANGTAAALKGGVTTVLDMPNNVPPCTTRALFEQKSDLFAQKSRVNYGLFMQATEGGARAPRTAAGVKIFMSQASALEAVRDVDVLADIFRKQTRVVIHAEDERRFVKKTAHHLRRPRAAVATALKSIETAWRRVPERQRPRLVIAHCSTANEIEWVARMKRLGHDIWAETCPHYFLYTQDDALKQGSRLQVNPPLRSEKDRAAIYEAVKNGTVDFVSTDHAPHLPKEKANPASSPSGIAGIEWLGTILLTLAKRDEISWKRYLELAGRQAALCYGIEGRGSIREGAWADLAFIQAGKRAKGTKEKIITRAAWHPYPTFGFSARVRATMVNGQARWVENRVLRGKAGMEVFE